MERTLISMILAETVHPASVHRKMVNWDD